MYWSRMHIIVKRMNFYKKKGPENPALLILSLVFYAAKKLITLRIAITQIAGCVLPAFPVKILITA